MPEVEDAQINEIYRILLSLKEQNKFNFNIFEKDREINTYFDDLTIIQ